MSCNDSLQTGQAHLIQPEEAGLTPEKELDRSLDVVKCSGLSAVSQAIIREVR